MIEILYKKLHQYISENNPDLLLKLEEKSETTLYLGNKISQVSELLEHLRTTNQPDYIIEQACMEALTKELCPSKFNYIKILLEDEFESVFNDFEKSGTLRFEIINLIDRSEETFKIIGFTEETEDSRQLRYAVTGIIHDYLSK